MGLTKVTYSMIEGAETNVLDFGADNTGANDCTAAFNAAIVAADGGAIWIPDGTYKVNSATNNGLWYINSGVTITGLPNLTDGATPVVSMNDTSRLTGRVIHLDNIPSGLGVQLGSSDPWLEKDVRSSTQMRAELSVISPYGQLAVTAASRTSDKAAGSTNGYNTIGINTYAVNDSAPDASNNLTAYAAYFEGIRESGCGPAFGFELDSVNRGSLVPFTPSSPLSYNPYTFGVLLNAGGGYSPSTLNPSSAGLAFGGNGTTWNRGIVFNSGSIDPSTYEAIAMPIVFGMAWYTSTTKTSFLDHRNHSRKIITSTAATSIQDENIKTGGSFGAEVATQALDFIYNENNYGYTGSANYKGASAFVLQKTNFVGGNARFSYSLNARNSDGSYAEVSVNGLGDNKFGPTPDNTMSCGSASGRWTEVFAVNGTINTSDANQKQDVKSLDVAEKRVATNIKSLIKKFKFKDAVKKKGSDARIHVGVIAQDVKAAFESEGLNAEQYGVFCSDKLEDGSVQLGVRYDELFAFVVSTL